ncbi:hypothetical protein ACFU9K_45825, partial [Streptomyces sp. NPDC057582]
GYRCPRYDGDTDDTSSPLPDTTSTKIIPRRSANVTTPSTEHEHTDLHADHPHLADAERVRGGWRHSHHHLADALHGHR